MCWAPAETPDLPSSPRSSRGPHHGAACDDVERLGGVRAETILALFEPAVRGLVAELGQRIGVNTGWATEAHLEPVGGPDLLLRPEPA